MELISDDLFDEIVADNVKKKSGDFEKRLLAMPDNLTRWHESLTRLLIKVDQQIIDLIKQKETDASNYSKMGTAGISLVAKSNAMYDDRQKKLVRFRYHVECKLSEVSMKIAGQESLDHLLAPLLKRAVEKHKELKKTHDPIDEALWLALNGEWGFDSIES